ncbi:glycerophosphocholine phosphodiesterase GPCPD1 [Drosophila hydei]|uniref:Glycerophosphocholine phosphodiesterase GPCPD1 n=1 Tax=Drosophila hydei TaxID=7224 RepID=A0A6J1LEX8_DROHY|nr:glycerophosphocholine phosphodiesterase GPCPD1 [Drosophila hydei]
MHRWFFANEREYCQVRGIDDASAFDANSDKAEPEIVYTDWPFCVTTAKPLQGNEYLAITGNCDVLGNWQPKSVHIMQASDCKCQCACQCIKFEATVRIPRNKDIEYRYCIVGYDPLADNVIIRFWEVMEHPRIIRMCHNMLRHCEVFGKIDRNATDINVDRGWATTETIVQFRIFNAPFLWLKQAPRLLYIYIQPMFETPPERCLGRTMDPVRLTMPITCRRSTINQQNLQMAFTEVANLNFSESLHMQPKQGVRCGPHDLQMYHFSLAHPLETLYRLDLYTYAHKAAPDEPSYHYGYGFVQPTDLHGSEGWLRININCASTHRPLIEMSLTYLIIRPLESIRCDLSVTYERFWSEKHLPMEIGHRGTGNTYRLGDDVYRENTMFAFNRAAVHNADMIEVDVMLTKDAQVVIYHDFVLKFALCSAWCVEKLLTEYDVMICPFEHFSRNRLLAMGGRKRGDSILVPVESFCYDELQLVQPLRYVSASGCSTVCERHLLNQKPFPLLRDVFNKDMLSLPPNVGINIEVKWPQQDTKGCWQRHSSKPKFDRNFYVDKVIEVVFRYAGNRRVMFSSFDADICIMLRYKQNFYPVLLMVQAAELPVQFADQRVNNMENAAFLASIMEFFGMNFYTSTLFKQPLILGHIKELHMQGIVWGSETTDAKIRDKLKRYGAVGVTYDRIDQQNQVGEELRGYVYCIDSIATRNHVKNLLESEKLIKCAKG